MHINGIRIDGFGIFHDLLVKDIPPGVVLLKGDNEAGKSTLLDFIRYMLFGYPLRRNMGNPYPPLCGGSPGGALFFDSENYGRFQVARKPGKSGGEVKVTRSSGAVEGREGLERILGGTTRSLYRSVYAFSLDELRSFDSLMEDSIASVIYGALRGGGVSDLPERKKRLDRRIEDLFKARGDRAAINKVLVELGRVRAELKSAQQGLAAFADMSWRLKELETGLEQKRRARLELRAELQRQLALQQAWATWESIRELEAELRNQPEQVDDFPEDGVLRLERLQEKSEAARRNITGLRAEIDKCERESAEHDFDPDLVRYGEDVRLLTEQLTAYTAAGKQKAGFAADVENIERQITELLRELGSDWTAARAREVDVSLFTREYIRSFRERLQAAQTAAEQAANRARTLESDLERARAEHVRAREELEAGQARAAGAEQGGERAEQAGEPAKALQQRKRILVELGLELARMERARIERIHLEQRLHDLDLETGGAAAAGMSPAMLLRVAGGVLAGIGLLAGIGCGIAFGAAAGIASFLLLGIAGAAIAGLSLMVGRGSGAQAGAGAARAANVRAELEAARAREHELGLELEALARRADLAQVPDGARVRELQDEAERAIRESEEQTRQLEFAGERLAEKEKALTALQERFQQARARQEAAERELAAARSEWRQWLGQNGLPRNLSPDTAMEALDRVRQVVQLDQSLREREQELGRCGVVAQEFVREARRVYALLQRPCPRPEDLPADLRRLDRECAGAMKTQSIREQLAKDLADKRARLGLVAAEADECEKAVRELLCAGRSADENSFRRRARCFTRRREISDSLVRLWGNLGEAVGSHDRDKLRAIFTGLSLVGLQDEARRMSAEDSELEQAINGLVDECARLRSEVRRLASAEDVSRLRAEEESLIEEFRDLAAEWGRLAVTRYLLEQALARFEKENQPGVIRVASDFFRTMTGGGYEKIFLPIGGDSLTVIDNAGRSKSSELLSRGTAEQLYLAIRFGYIMNYDADSEKLPVIMDDVLVNFDHDRAAAAAGAILELGRTHQVLFFTCHDYVLDLFREMSDDLPVYCMAEGRIG